MHGPLGWKILSCTSTLNVSKCSWEMSSFNGIRNAECVQSTISYQWKQTIQLIHVNSINKAILNVIPENPVLKHCWNIEKQTCIGLIKQAIIVMLIIEKTTLDSVVRYLLSTSFIWISIKNQVRSNTCNCIVSWNYYIGSMAMLQKKVCKAFWLTHKLLYLYKYKIHISTSFHWNKGSVLLLLQETENHIRIAAGLTNIYKLTCRIHLLHRI